MLEVVVTRQALDRILEELTGRGALIGPVMSQNGTVAFEHVSRPGQILREYDNSVVPPKNLLIPQCERLFSFAAHDQLVEILPSAEPRVVFGIRPCDAAAFRYLDQVYGGESEDCYYAARRNKITLMGLACNSPGQSCFCTSFDPAGPHSTREMDALITDLGTGSLYIQCMTERGEKLLGGQGSSPSPAERKAKEDLKASAQSRITRKLQVPDDLGALFTHRFWDESSKKCITCGICRYLCPICSCFSVTDEDGLRVKYWDACGFAMFTREAAGSNPRAKKAERYKQWYYHKFDYYKRKTGDYLCVGCGRCIANCPVRIDFAEVLAEASQL